MQGPHEEIGAALRTVAAGTGLTVTEYPELRGASVVGEVVEAYVLVHASGWQLDLWRHHGINPYRVLYTTDLTEAIQLAVAEARGSR